MGASSLPSSCWARGGCRAVGKRAERVRAATFGENTVGEGVGAGLGVGEEGAGSGMGMGCDCCSGWLGWGGGGEEKENVSGLVRMVVERSREKRSGWRSGKREGEGEEEPERTRWEPTTSQRPEAAVTGDELKETVHSNTPSTCGGGGGGEGGHRVRLYSTRVWVEGWVEVGFQGVYCGSLRGKQSHPVAVYVPASMCGVVWWEWWEGEKWR